MAASIAGRSYLFKCRRKLPVTQFVRYKSKKKKGPLNSGWQLQPTQYVLLPEIPPDTPETNWLMRATHENARVSEITPRSVLTGVSKLSILAEVDFAAHIRTISGFGTKRTFEKIVEPLDRIFAPCFHALGASRLAMCVNEPHHEFASSIRKVESRVHRMQHDQIFQKYTYNALREISSGRDQLTEQQCHLVDVMMHHMQIRGVPLSGQEFKAFEYFMKLIVEETHKFKYHVAVDNHNFKYEFDDFDFIGEIPKHLALALSTNETNPSVGPWSVDFSPQKYETFMKYCNRRSQREKVYMRLVNRAIGEGNNLHITNHMLIKSIRETEMTLAEMFGFDNMAEQYVENSRMAGSVQNISNVIEECRLRLKTLSDNEVQEVEDWAKFQGFGGTDLQMWDVPYWRRRYREEFLSVDTDRIAQYFPFPDVFQKLLQFASDAFDVEFKDITSEVDTWHDSVQVFAVFNKKDPSTLQGTFYVDPYDRQPEKYPTFQSWVIRERCDLVGSTAVSFLNLGFNPPEPDGNPSMLEPGDLKVLLREFGRMLSQMMTQAPFLDLSADGAYQLDARQIAPMVMEMYFTLPNKMRWLSCAGADGSTLSQDLIVSLIKGTWHMRNHDKMYEMFMSAYDVEMHTTNTHFYQARLKMWYDYMCIPLHEGDNHPCSMEDVFVTFPHPLKVYCSHWSEMVAADIVEAFKEAEEESPDKLKAVFKRYRDTYLVLGPSIPAMEVFRRFRGRDPSQDALLRRYEKLPL